jgi:hypothetical protein
LDAFVVRLFLGPSREGRGNLVLIDGLDLNDGNQKAGDELDPR